MAKTHRLLEPTPVRTSVRAAVDGLELVEIDSSAVAALAAEWVEASFELPDWRAPVFLDESDPNVTRRDLVDFFFVGNAINFAFRDFETGEKFVAEYDSEQWAGAFGMWACLKRAHDDGVPVLSPQFLSGLSSDEFDEIFQPAGDTEIPLRERRLQVLRAIGENALADCDGRFHAVVEDSSRRLYDDGDGIVDRIVRIFPSFRDESTLAAGRESVDVRFDKRAQLLPAMLYGRFGDAPRTVVEDPAAFTVFADYNLPNVLRSEGVLNYDDELARRIDDGEVLRSGERAEVEIRVATVAAADRLLTRLDERRRRPVYGPHLDYKLFTHRDTVSTPPHRSETTAY